MKKNLTVRAVALAGVMALAACGDSPFQVIEALEFAPSLGINLAEMEKLSSGVYILDVVVGDGPLAVDGAEVTIDYVGLLADGSSFGSGTFPYLVGGGGVIAGFAQGIYGMAEGGQRRIIIPPELGYADADQDAIPPGSVLIFDVTLQTVVPPDAPTPTSGR